MNRIFLLLLIGAATFFILLLASNPDLFNDIWLWLIGLAGGLIKVFNLLVGKVKSFHEDIVKATPKDKSDQPQVLQKPGK